MRDQTLLLTLLSIPLIVFLAAGFREVILARLVPTTARAQPAADDPISRKRDAKRFNERCKLAATFLNNLGVAIFVAVTLSPVARSEALTTSNLAIGFGIAFVLHIWGQMVLQFWKSED